jgi:type IV pilus assembly protein PilF
MKRVKTWILVVSALAVLGGCASKSPPKKSQTEDPATLNLQLGMAYIQSGELDIALEKLNKALEYDSSMPQTYNALGVLYEETGKEKLAGKHYQQALALDSHYNVARMNYARFLCTNGQAQEGEIQYLAVADDPDYPAPEDAYAGAAVCALKIPDHDLAEAYLNKALELRPDATRALFQLADMSYAQGRYQQARSYLQRYHARAQYGPESLWLAISIENALGNRQQSQIYSQMLASRFASSDQARQLR